MGSFISFSPTINLYVDFSHRLSLEATEDPAKNMQGGRCGAIGNRESECAEWEFLADGEAPAPLLWMLRDTLCASRSSRLLAGGSYVRRGSFLLFAEGCFAKIGAVRST